MFELKIKKLSQEEQKYIEQTRKEMIERAIEEIDERLKKTVNKYCRCEDSTICACSDPFPHCMYCCKEITSRKTRRVNKRKAIEWRDYLLESLKDIDEARAYVNAALETKDNRVIEHAKKIIRQTGHVIMYFRDERVNGNPNLIKRVSQAFR